MFDSGGVDGVLKVIDFGSSVFVQDAEMVRAMPYCPPPSATCAAKAHTHAVAVAPCTSRTQHHPQRG